MVEVKKFYGEWCVPCKMLSPVIEEIKGELPNVLFVDIDVDEEYEMASKYGVRGVPTVIIEKDGVEVKRFVGLQPKGAIVEAINTNLN
jgi:thioredoxin 1